jgi:2Fe-2S ferredoxin
MYVPKVVFKKANGDEITIEAPCGLSLLEIAHQNGLQDDLEGACEGSLACSTCHVVVDPAWFNLLPATTEAEEDMLDLAFGLEATSRLGCQIIMKEELDGLTVTIPSESRNFSTKDRKQG